MVIAEGSVVEFIGDSITDARRRLDRSSGLGHGYVRMIHDALSPRGCRVVNRGVSGDCTRDLVQRWHEDCLEIRPDVLTIFVGINDVWRRYDEGSVTALSSFEGDYRLLVTSALAASISRIVLMEPFLVAVEAGQESWREDLDPKRRVVAALAEEFSLPFVPLDSVMRARAAELGAEAISIDGIHPTELGHRIIADAWLAVVT